MKVHGSNYYKEEAWKFMDFGLRETINYFIIPFLDGNILTVYHSGTRLWMVTSHFSRLKFEVILCQWLFYLYFIILVNLWVIISFWLLYQI